MKHSFCAELAEIIIEIPLLFAKKRKKKKRLIHFKKMFLFQKKFFLQRKTVQIKNSKEF